MKKCHIFLSLALSIFPLNSYTYGFCFCCDGEPEDGFECSFYDPTAPLTPVLPIKKIKRSSSIDLFAKIEEEQEKECIKKEDINWEKMFQSKTEGNNLPYDNKKKYQSITVISSDDDFSDDSSVLSDYELPFAQEESHSLMIKKE